MSNIYSKKPVIILSVIEPGTMGDLSFVNKMIDSYQNQENDQPFVILLNDLGDESLKDKILGAPNEYVLNLIVNGFKHSQDYSILKTGQGVVTTLLNLETDSIKEFNKIVEEATEELKFKSTFSLS